MSVSIIFAIVTRGPIRRVDQLTGKHFHVVTPCVIYIQGRISK